MLTVLLAVGVVAAVIQARRREAPRVLIGLGLVSLLLFFGRPTLGPIFDLLPGGGDLFLRRFISGVHLAGIYLIGLGGVYLVHLCATSRASLDAVASSDRGRGRGDRRARARARLLGAGSVRARGATWIDEQARAEATDGVGFAALVERARGLGPGRIFAGLRGPAVAAYRSGRCPASRPS